MADIAPLAGHAHLEYLSLFGTRVSDGAALKTLPKLAKLDVGGTILADVNWQNELPGVNVLISHDHFVWVKDASGARLDVRLTKRYPER